VSNLLFRNEPGKMFKRPVIGFLGIRREKAARYLPAAEVVTDAIAADSPPVAGIRTCTHRLVLGNLTFHRIIGGYTDEFAFRLRRKLQIRHG
jgi:hypothetical protein